LYALPNIITMIKYIMIWGRQKPIHTKFWYENLKGHHLGDLVKDGGKGGGGI
jgi:hypothetical protein